MMVINTTLTTKLDKIVTKIVQKEAAIKREYGLIPEALLLANHCGRGSRGGIVGKSPKRDMRDDKRDDKRDIKGANDRKEKDFWKCFHCQQ
jgi:hypothetical protein